MPKIQILDAHVAELIAAGEVVERPASVAKELLENSIDAGATQITLSITRGGIEQLQIADNGCGIDVEDMDKAFIRHATSKIREEQDLEEIHTLGFRGEALASVAGVARVEVLSRTDDEEFACEYHIAGGVKQGMETGARPVGTTITVNQLFYNTPARMKFLKKDTTEGTYVADVIQHLSLSHPEISFRFIRDGKMQFLTPGDGNLRSTARAVLGREFSSDLLDVDCQTGLYQVTGLVTPPRAGRASRGMQNFFINGRYVKNRTMLAALEAAFKGTLMKGKYPGCILMLSMPCKLVDVNVHPAKTEVRFARENEVFDAVYHAVKAALTAPGSGEQHFHFAEEPAEKQEQTAPEAAQPDKPVSLPAQPQYQVVPQPQKHFAVMSAQEYRNLHTSPAKPDIAAIPASEPVPMRSSAVAYGKTEGFPLAGEQTLDILPEEPERMGQEPTTAFLEPIEEEKPQTFGLSAVLPQQEEKPEQTRMEPEPEIVPLQYVGEVFKTYIITQRGDELCLIDKHAAHERMLYEQLAKNYGKVPGQLLLSPVRVELSAEEKQGLMENLELLSDAGLDVTDFGGNTVLVREVPADIRVNSVEDMLLEVADKLAHGSKDALSEKTEWVLHSMSCRAAIKAGDKDDPRGLLHLAEQILAGKIPPFCPHGRPVVLKLTKREVEKQFGRIV